MSAADASPKFDDYFTVSQAARFLGVSSATLRNWDRCGKLKPRRHPHSGYRIYLHEDLQSLLESVETAAASAAPLAPQADWDSLSEGEHLVQFYETDDYLVQSISDYLAASLRQGQAALAIVTAEHRTALEASLAKRGVDVADAVASERLTLFEASDVLAKFMIDREPSAELFEATVGEAIARLSGRFSRLHAFGEMVALLWADGLRDAAIQLERMWEELAKAHRFCLLCAYPLDAFARADDDDSMDGICNCHTRVLPAESFTAITEPEERLRTVALLQQKAVSLRAEIEHREQMQAALAQHERELEDFFDNAIHGIHKVGPDGVILWANRADHELLGYTAEEYIGRPIADFHADADVIAQMLRRLNAGETLENVPARLRCKNGKIKHVLISSNGCFENGRLRYTRCFTRDVTQQWQAEQVLRDADRRKDEFLATLAHELRNPLAPLSNSLQVLRLRGSDEQALEIMQRQIAQLTRLVDDLLDVSRISRNQIELRKQRVDLAGIIQNAMETSRPLVEAADQSLIIRLPEQPLILQADAVRLSQVIANLLNNSSKYTPRGGKIWLTAERAGREAEIRVRDTGIGISCEALPHVFDMFRQFDRPVESAPEGLGIGLSLARRLVEQHGGTVVAASEGQGKGSEFIVRLPIEQLAAERAPKNGSPALTTNGQKVLIVDDNHDSGETLGKLLTLKGHQVRIATGGLEAIDVAEQFLPDVILMDVGMPGLNGYETTRRIRERPWGQCARIIALTGWGQAEDVRRSLEAGCSAHLVKPVDFSALERLLVNGSK